MGAVDVAAITPLAWTVLALGALVVGFSKTSFGGIGILSVVAFAAALPAKASTGAVLPLLILGDVVAVALYRRHAEWKLLVRLLPATLVGLLLGAVFLDSVDDVALRRFIGALMLVLALLQVRSVLHRPGRAAEAAATGAASEPGVAAVEPSVAAVEPGGPETWSPTRRRVVAGLAGSGAGFATMVANAAGPISAMYLLVMRVSKMSFVGTGAWLYFIVNCAKVPLSAGLGLIDVESLKLDLLLAPALLLGAWAGVTVLRRVPQRLFAGLTLALTALSAVALLLPSP